MAEGEVLVKISHKPPRSHNRSMPRSALELSTATLLHYMSCLCTVGRKCSRLIPVHSLSGLQHIQDIPKTLAGLTGSGAVRASKGAPCHAGTPTMPSCRLPAECRSTRAHTHTHTRACAHTHTHAHVCMYVCMYVFMYVCMYIYIYTYTRCKHKRAHYILYPSYKRP